MGHRCCRPGWPFVLLLAVALFGDFTSADATPGAGGGPHTPLPFAVGLIGDWGYTPDQRGRLPALIDHMNAAGLVDQPMVAGSPPRPVRNFTRVETHGPRVKWVRASVDPTRPGVFAFRPEDPGPG